MNEYRDETFHDNALIYLELILLIISVYLFVVNENIKEQIRGYDWRITQSEQLLEQAKEDYYQRQWIRFDVSSVPSDAAIDSITWTSCDSMMAMSYADIDSISSAFHLHLMTGRAQKFVSPTIDTLY
jgi:hypothetical protein